MTDPSKSVHPTGEYEPSEALMENVPWTAHGYADAVKIVKAVAAYLADPAHAGDLRAFADATMERIGWIDHFQAQVDGLYRVRTDS